MTESKEHLSCLMDGETRAAGTAISASSFLADDTGMSATWRRYHLVRPPPRRGPACTRK